MEAVRALLEDRLAPVVLVAGTPAAEAALANANGLTLVDLLRPQARVTGMNVPIRVGEFSSRISELPLRLVAWNTVYQPTPDVVDEHLRGVLTTAAQQHAGLQPIPNLEQVARADSPDALTPWFAVYRSEFVRLMQFGEHEAVDHPVGAIFFVPSDSPDAPAYCEALKGKLEPPPLMGRELMLPAKDTMFVKFYVLLHDAAAPGADDARAEANFAALQGAYGAANVAMLRINTRAAAISAAGGASDAPGVPEPLPPSLFRPSRRATLPGGGAGEPDSRPPEPPGGLGCALAPADLAAAGQLLRDFAQGCLLPKLEERVSRLNLSVTAMRKGLRNRITRLFKAGGDGGGGAGGGPAEQPPYVWHSVEAQMRQLADLALLLGFREFAVATYRLAAQDYLAAGHNKWYAGAEEMIGLVQAQGGDPGADPVKYLGRAIEHYGRTAGRGGRMLATRAAITCAAYQTATGRHGAAVQTLMRAHYEEDNARAALLLEQAAYAQIRQVPPARRKFGFQLVLAGLRFHAARQRRLSAHCYQQVLAVYPGRSWRFIAEHIADIAAKQCGEFGDLAGAAAHARALLEGSDHRPPAAQQHYLAHFLETVARVQQQQGSAMVPIEGLRLPVVTTDTVVVHASDQRCSGNAAAAAQPPSAWASLEAAAAGAEMPSSNWLEGGKQVKDGEEYTSVASGEDLSVDVTFSNPLALKLRLTAVRLICEFSPPAESTGSSSGSVPAPLGPQPSPPQPGGGAAAEPEAGEVQVLPAAFTLHPGETLTERLSLRPLAPGWLRVTGVAWVVEGGAEGRATLDIRGRHRKKPKGDRPSQRKHYPPHRRLLFHVLPGMPRLAVSAEALPSRLFAGELLRLPVKITNVGRLPARALKLAAADGAGVALCALDSSAASTATASAAALLEEGGQAGGGVGVRQESLEPVVRRRRDGRVTALFNVTAGDGDRELQPGESVGAVLWLHAPAAPGAWEFNLVWYCEPVASVPLQMRFRSLRTAHTITVVPLLGAGPGLSPSGADLLQYLLRLDLDCDREGAPVEVCQITALTRGADAGWRIAPVTATGRTDGTASAASAAVRTARPALRLAPGDSSCQFFRLLPSTARGVASKDAPGPAPLLYFLEEGRPGGRSEAGGDAGEDTLPQGQQQQQQQQQGVSEGAIGTQAPDAEPPLDLAIVWQVAATTDSSSSSGPAPQGVSGPRVGMVALYDLCAAQRLNPVRMQLSGPAGPVRHDFRGRSLCAVPLKLQLRNCGAAPAALTVRAASAWEGYSTANAWFAAPPRPGGRGSGGGSGSPFSSARGLPGDGSGGGGGGPSPRAAGGAALGAPLGPSGLGGGSTPPQRLGGSPAAASPARSPRLGGGADGGAGQAVGLLQAGLPPSAEHVWCGRTVAPVGPLAPGAMAEVVLCVAVFRPGAHVLDDYVVDWECSSGGGGSGDGGRVLRGSKVGGPFVLRVEAAGSGSGGGAPAAAPAVDLIS